MTDETQRTHFWLCDLCSHDADCEIPEQRTNVEGCDLFTPKDGGVAFSTRAPDPQYTVTEVIHGFEDMFRRGMDDLSFELGKHGLCVAGLNLNIHDNQSPYGNTSPVESQSFAVQIVVKSRGAPRG